MPMLTYTTPILFREVVWTAVYIVRREYFEKFVASQNLNCKSKPFLIDIPKYRSNCIDAAVVVLSFITTK